LLARSKRFFLDRFGIRRKDGSLSFFHQNFSPQDKPFAPQLGSIINCRICSVAQNECLIPGILLATPAQELGVA
jgi:hypothetical protein